jgi:hypothetical protein
VISTRIGIAGALIGLGAGLTACMGGIVPPGSTAGSTYGGAYSARFATKPEPKKEETKSAKVTAPPAAPGPYDRPGFVTRVEKNRVWVFRKGSKDLSSFLKGGEPGKSATLVGAGPEGMTLRGPDIDTLESYLVARQGYEVFFRDGRYWVFKEGSMDAAWFAMGGSELSKTVTLVGAGPGGRTVRGADMETAQGYVSAPPSQ